MSSTGSNGAAAVVALLAERAAAPGAASVAPPVATATVAREPPYAALLFVATALALAGVFLTLHGAPAYALLLWEGGAGVAAWVYVHPAVGAFLFGAAGIQAPMAAHLWGDPLCVRRRLGRLLLAAVAAVDER